jgi:hypothetical protein
MRYIAGFFGILALLFVVLFMLSGFDIWQAFFFVDLPTIFSFMFLTAIILFATGEFKIFIAAVNAILSKSYVISAEETKKAIRLFRLLRKSNLYFSFIIAIFVSTLMLFDLSDVYTLGPNLAFILHALFYGLLVNLALVNPAIYILKGR